MTWKRLNTLAEILLSMPMKEVSAIEECESPKIFSPKWRIETEYEYEQNYLETSGELMIIKQTETKYELDTPVDKVISVKSVDYDLVDELIKVGFQPKDYYAKNVVMILTESGNRAYMDSLKEKLEE